jgi:hypothetical protein
MTDANAHLLKYAIKTTNGGWRYPLVEHDRWMNWAQNTCERHRVNSQKSFYIKKHPDDANMSEARLKFIVNNPDRAEFNKLLSRMQMYNANITGSKAYFYKRRTELESLMESCWMPTMWFTLSCVDNHWEDLHRILVGLENYPEACNTEKKKAEHRRKLVRDNILWMLSFIVAFKPCLTNYLVLLGLKRNGLGSESSIKGEGLHTRTDAFD